MMTRRDFLKITGLSTVALGAGLTIGNLTSNKNSYYAVAGFIPDDEEILSRLIFSFRDRIKSSTGSVIVADPKFYQVINKFDLQANGTDYSGRGNLKYMISRLERKTDSDIIVSDNENVIYSLDDFNYSFTSIRKEIKDRRAQYYFTAEYTETGFLSSIIKSNKREVVIENEKGVVDRIALDKNYKNIIIDGAAGKTGLKIENNIAKVHTSSCRHHICEQSSAGTAGNIIACAPNKVLIKIV